MLKGFSEDKDSHAADDSMESKYVGVFFLYKHLVENVLSQDAERLS